MNLQVSRIWHLRHTRPRDTSGRFLPARYLWTRPDKLSRWVHLPMADDAMREHAAWLTQQSRRVIRDLALIAIAAALVFWFTH